MKNTLQHMTGGHAIKALFWNENLESKCSDKMHIICVFIPLIPGNLKFSSLSVSPFVSFYYFCILQSSKLGGKKKGSHDHWKGFISSSTETALDHLVENLWNTVN